MGENSHKLPLNNTLLSQSLNLRVVNGIESRDVILLTEVCLPVTDIKAVYKGI